MATSTAVPCLPLSCFPAPTKVFFSSHHFRPISILSLSSKGLHFSPPYISKNSQKNANFWRLGASSEEVLALEPTIDKTQEIVVTDENLGSPIISILLIIAFVGLSILTIGVIYIAVADFLQKRETENFEKEEATKKKKSNKKRNVRAKTGPRGFGQKIEEYDD